MAIMMLVLTVSNHFHFAHLYILFLFVYYFLSVLGIVGTYLRYHLSILNSKNKNFPYGTFTANIIGTIIAAAVTTISKFSVDYYNIQIQSILYGLIVGFCGCLTTISTLAQEINTLSEISSYIYGLLTTIIAQIFIILIFSIYAFSTINQHSDAIVTMKSTTYNYTNDNHYNNNKHHHQHIDLCKASQDLCSNLLEKINCAPQYRINIACKHKYNDTNHYHNHRDDSIYYDDDGNDNNNNSNNDYSICKCGNFNGNYIQNLLIKSQIYSNISNSIVSVWPNDAWNYNQPTEVIDYCLTYINVCNDYLNKINCQVYLRKVIGCNQLGIMNVINQCYCTGNDNDNDNDRSSSSSSSSRSSRISSSTSSVIKDLIIKTLLTRRYDLVPYHGYITRKHINFEDSYIDICDKVLQHIQCPSMMRCIVGNNIYGNYLTWQGICLCSVKKSCERQTSSTSSFSSSKSKSSDANYHPFDISDYISTIIFDTSLGSSYSSLLVSSSSLSSSSTTTLSSLSSSLSSTTTTTSAEEKAKHTDSTTTTTWNVCWSYNKICAHFLHKMNCPLQLQTIYSCKNITTYPQLQQQQEQQQQQQQLSGQQQGQEHEYQRYDYQYGRIENITSICACGMLNTLNQRPLELVIEALSNELLHNQYNYIPSSQPPYTLMLKSNAFKQLTQRG